MCFAHAVCSAMGRHSEALDTLHVLACHDDVPQETPVAVCLCRALTLACAGRADEAEEGWRE